MILQSGYPPVPFFGPTYEPEGVGNPVHVYAAGALRILDDTRAHTMIPIHFETTNEPFDVYRPREVLEHLMRERPEYRDRVVILDIGEQTTIRR